MSRYLWVLLAISVASAHQGRWNWPGGSSDSNSEEDSDSGSSSDSSSEENNSGRRKNVIACENDTADLTCKNGKVIQVTWANFGRTSRALPRCGAGWGQWRTWGRNFQKCDTSDSTTATVQGLCDGEATCSVTASEAVLGDGCPEGYACTKYLQVRYKCVKQEVTTMAPVSCGALPSDDLNGSWDQAYCTTEDFTSGRSCTLNCDPGYNGGGVVTCDDSGAYGDVPTCEQVVCAENGFGRATATRNGIWIPSDCGRSPVTAGQTCKLSCSNSFFIEGTTDVVEADITCQNDGTLSIELPFCV